MNTLIHIRRASPADSQALRTMQALSMRRLGIEHYDEDVIEAFIAQAGTMDDTLLSDGTYFAAHVGNLLVGCGGWSRRMPNDAAHTTDAGARSEARSATIRSIFVHPAWARRGIARQVMARIESDIRAAGFERAGMTATLTGVPFYRRLGYRSAMPMTLDLKEGRYFVGLTMHKTLAAIGRDPLASAA